MNTFQRVGADSNTSVGRAFEAEAMAFFATQGIVLTPSLSVPVGIGPVKKQHRFDLGSEAPPVLVECKSHTWTTGGNMPSAKLTVWNEAMYYFHVAPAHYRKVLFVLKHHHAGKGLTLAAYYLRTHAHLIPVGVEIWEFDPVLKTAERIC